MLTQIQLPNSAIESGIECMYLFCFSCSYYVANIIWKLFEDGVVCGGGGSGGSSSSSGSGKMGDHMFSISGVALLISHIFIQDCF